MTTPCGSTHNTKPSISEAMAAYETYDEGRNFIFKSNLLSRFYRVAVDNSYPFYYIYGGTQDSNSMGGRQPATATVYQRDGSSPRAAMASG
jgi:hypothetical protein